jgi:hypothetical protein
MRRLWVCVGLSLAAAGCGGAPTSPAGTGAEAAARTFFEALLRRDDRQAHRALLPDEQARCGPEPFARLAQAYRRKLGFEPKAVHVRSCDEQGTEAIAHVVFTGVAGGHERFFKDAIELRRGGQGWGVVLPARFGR